MEPGTAVKTEEVFKLSDRVNRISESPTMIVLQAAAALKAKGVDVADFGAGEPDFPTPEHIKRAAIQALEQNHTKYTPVPGIPALRQAICEWHAKELGSSYQPAECVVNVGGAQDSACRFGNDRARRVQRANHGVRPFERSGDRRLIGRVALEDPQMGVSDRHFSGERTRAVTECPTARACFTTCMPVPPAAPRTVMFMMASWCIAPRRALACV